MGRHSVGPKGLRVTPVKLTPTSEHWLFARMRVPTAKASEIWYKVTRDGHAVDVPGYYELQEIVPPSPTSSPKCA
ncbi:hypothetical protein AB0F17_34965 [Nonomuraea sp. NPDC026600]|uniref:hypothetical protein n=1 Tax=Nonomuraea sp. NPDC026600 TaxID=3155363 RepID=UPI0033D66367